MEKYLLQNLTSSRRSTYLDPANLTEPLTVAEMLDVMHILNNLSGDIDAFKEKINTKLVKVVHNKRSYVGTMLLRHLFLFSFVWQVINVILATVLYPKRGQSDLNPQELTILISIMAVFQVIHLGLVFVTSIKLCRKVIHKTAAPLFVAQSFLSTLFMYSGMYSLIFCVFPNSFAGVNPEESHISIAARFLYFSTATMTTVGYGDVNASYWVSEVVVSTQMLISLTYTVIIFTQGLAHFNTPYIIPKKKNDDDVINEARHTIMVNS